MARKGNQPKNRVNRQSSNIKKKGPDSCTPPDMKARGAACDGKVCPGEQLPDCSIPGSPSADSMKKTSHAADENRIKQSSGKFLRKEKQGIDEETNPKQSVSFMNTTINCSASSPFTDTSGMEKEALSGRGSKNSESGLGYLFSCSHLKDMKENVAISGNVLVSNLRLSATPVLKVAGEWLKRQRPLFATVSTKICGFCDYSRKKIQQASPILLKWFIHFWNIMFLLSTVWLDCTLRGIDSFIRLGTTSFFLVIWCSILSLIVMVGVSKFFIAVAIAAFVGVFIGFTLGFLVNIISGAAFLWLYGSFWTTAIVILMGGLAFMSSHDRLALFVIKAYSLYSAWAYVGWLGLLLALHLSFISSDILMHCLKNNINQRRRSNQASEQSGGMEGQQSFFDDEAFQASFSENGHGLSTDRGPGIPSTSGAESDITAEDEVVRLINCSDHYSALGLHRYENVDVNLLKKEYRKKAMLVHPDKNMGNEKAAEAFKKLQNAYEVLFDSLKRKAYDDELRKEELLNCFRRLQRRSQKSREHGFFASGFEHSQAAGKDPSGDSRRIACKKCSNFHLWIHVERSKSQARWCQDCKDFHQTKDGDGWVEQSSQPFFFGLLQKVDTPCAYVCADSRIYDATQWYMCQGMRCPANTHKPSFHVNTGITSKQTTSSKGPTTSGKRNGRMPEESMTEEEFFKWLQNAVEAGVFDNFGGSTSAESPSAKAGNSPKSSGGGSGSGGNKKKKRGKKQW
ncbi:hypothetical protein K2173_017358 [Erythroxylum novogranatense]|uniref:J domain-containing protein n=1 Tax=Erythroxylum novogranatense TaxID=1862640 RepID=A0AAV8TMI3_9ROSI|nr:hypothetical protein K2173_017358 [Erythroxylum novogranatense]